MPTSFKNIGTRCYFQHSAICDVRTRMNQPGHLGHSQGHIPYQGRHCICYFVIHALFPIILAPNLWFGGKRDRRPRSTWGDCSSPPTLRLLHLSLYLFCITSSEKTYFRPSDPTCPVLWISTSRITTMTKKYTTQSLF